MEPAVQQQLTKLVSVRLCPPVTGQILLDVVVNCPQPGDPSYQQFCQVSRAGWSSHEQGRECHHLLPARLLCPAAAADS